MSNYGNPPPDPYGQNPYGGQPAGMPGAGASHAANFASWGERLGAALIDGLLSLLAQILILVGIVVAVRNTTTTFNEATGQYVTSGGPSAFSLALIGLGSLMGLAFYVWNVCIKQGNTGYTIGKGILGIKLVKAETGQPIGAGMAFVRHLAHVLDAIPCYVGYFWPLWDAQRQTFADKVIGTYVIDQPKG